MLQNAIGSTTKGKEANQMHRWNIFHAIAPFGALITALLIIQQKPQVYVGSYFREYTYYPMLFVFSSLILISIAVIAPLTLKETKNSFIFFFSLYPLWFFGAIMPHYYNNAFGGAWASWLIFLLATVVQCILTGILHDTETSN